MIQAMLLDAEEQYLQSYQVKVWVDLLKEAFYNADDLLDEFSTDVLLKQMMIDNKMVKEVCLFFSSSNPFVYGLKMAHKIEKVRSKLYDIAENKKFHLDKLPEKTFPMLGEREQTHSSLPQVVVGREDDKKKTIDFLLSSSHWENVSIISIVGIGGLGETTLAQLGYNDVVVKSYFKLKIWVCISENFDIKIIVEKILESLEGDGKYGWRQVSRSNHVCKLTSINRIIRIQIQSSPTSNIGIDLDKLTNGKKDKLIIFIPPGKYFRPIGEHERKLASWLGYCARSYGPPKEPWNAIEARYRTRLWSMIQDYFDVSPESPEKWKKLEEIQKLHLKYLKYSSDDERLQHVPEGLTVDTWKEMFKVFANEDFQEEMQRIEKQPTNDNDTSPTPDDVLKEVFGIRSVMSMVKD
ncbi:hypothetical protein GH714_035731 [Hevea brasiliensis]|uniref:NB-ARC domain-containing protein n=1 Tax=Hevea brasiliensis TaxID=3981 RepID=A0A6A6KKB3_HEVBR|nr:hypothetical protein GH714_035731 [Hevea brasiliensis]